MQYKQKRYNRNRLEILLVFNERIEKTYIFEYY